MCFSASASFVAAGLTGAIGLVSISRIRQPRDLALAMAPIFFAVQQALEGALWLVLQTGGERETTSRLAFAYLVFAQAFWPLYSPITCWLAEPQVGRRRLMLLTVVLGLAVSGFLLWALSAQSPTASIIDGHLVYRASQTSPLIIGIPYVTATCLPLLASSRRGLAGLGVLVLAGAIISYVFYWQAFLSVWCFFAAIASGVVLYQVEVTRRHPDRVVAA